MYINWSVEVSLRGAVGALQDEWLKSSPWIEGFSGDRKENIEGIFSKRYGSKWVINRLQEMSSILIQRLGNGAWVIATNECARG